jgi:hypothetical protein
MLEHASRRGQHNLFLEHFFDLPDLFFDFAGFMFGSTLSFQVRIVRDLACLSFEFAFCFMKSAFDLILRTRVHLFSPYREILPGSKERKCGLDRFRHVVRCVDLN